MLAIGDDVAEVVGRGRRDLVGDERGPAEVASLGGFAVTLRAIFLEDGIVGQPRVGRRSLPAAAANAMSNEKKMIVTREFSLRTSLRLVDLQSLQSHPDRATSTTIVIPTEVQRPAG